MRCQKCGREIHPHSKNCFYCGAPQKNGLSTGAVVGITLGSIALAFLLLFGSCIGCVVCSSSSSNVASSVASNNARSAEEKVWSDYYDNHKSDYTEIDITTLHEHKSDFKNEKVLTVAKISGKESYSFKTSIESSNSLFKEYQFSFKEYDDILKYYKNGELVTIIGTVQSGGWVDVNVKDCHIIASGEKSQSKAKELNKLVYEKPTENSNKISAAGSSVWSIGYTNISDFDFYIDKNEIYIKEYKGTSRKIRLRSAYEIDGVKRNVVAFTDATFFCNNIVSAIIPEGVKTVTNNMFNSCGVKFVYLPSTLEKPQESFWSYFHDVEKIYYGGTEEQWNAICTVDRSRLDVKQIIFNANPDDLK